MATEEENRNWQWVSDHWSIQEDAWRPLESSHGLPSSSKLESGGSTGDAAKGLYYPVPGFMPDNQKDSNAELRPEIRRWLHLQPNCGNPNNYSKEQSDTIDENSGLNSAAAVNQHVHITGDKQLDEGHDIQNRLKDDVGTFVDSPRRAFLACLENDQDNKLKELKAIANDDLQKASNKEVGEFCTDGEQSEKLCSELESQWIEVEKNEPWWRTADKDDLSSLVSNKKLEQFENCDLPQPQTKYFRSGPSECSPLINQDTVIATLDQNAEKDLDNHRLGNPTWVCMSKTHCIPGALQCLPSSSDKLLSRNQGFAIEVDETEKIQMIDSDLTKAQLLEALCHSQTRAREAEKAAQEAYNDKEHIINHFFRQASHLFAYRQWLQLLQIETLYIHLKNNKGKPIFPNLPPFLAPLSKSGNLWKVRRKVTKRKVAPLNYKMSRCFVSFAVGLSLVGAGLLLGWTLGRLFPAL